ncbi:hypothetical protein WJ64_32775 [Burkholderia ubonensis]|nr:hypothetical protein WJ64_32775 [Burkholderia ubonensis]
MSFEIAKKENCGETLYIERKKEMVIYALYQAVDNIVLVGILNKCLTEFTYGDLLPAFSTVTV